ncbi:MAG: hypothetical protein HFG54_15100 [Lachnospiraceae bacterium]|nr:hypothetical protein [Lachnospiraceae bacterium]
MIDFTKLELLFLQKMISSNIRDLERRIERNERLLSTIYREDVQEKIAITSSELRNMRSILSRLEDEISRIALS